jgi:4-aminobutyrate aminotransferase-like enzyme/Ser/Thr protein kinase RdoA (MazF antagonist)
MSTAVGRPRLREEDAIALAQDVYGLRASACSLPSERDQNFLLTTDEGPYVLKIARTGERRAEIELQNDTLARVRSRDPSLPLPRLRPTAAGDLLATVTVPGGATHLVRLLTYLSGNLLAESRPQTPDLLRRLGRFLGRLDLALDGFRHPAAVDRDLDWDPKRLPAVVARHTAAIADRARRARVEAVLAQYEATAAPLLGALRTSVIHNDANDYNVVVGPPAPEDREIVGLIDFGDLVQAPAVWEPAVAVAYALLGKADPLAAAAAVVAGYHDVFPLTEPELEVLWSLARLRLAGSVCLSAVRRSDEPDNAYLTISEAPAWAALEALDGIHPRFAHYTLRQACGLSPCPSTAAVVAGLRRGADAIAPVVETDPNRCIVLDLSVGSPDFATPGEATDLRRLETWIFKKMSDAGTDLAIGRYDEARLVYAGDAYRVPAGECAEWRTVHLGLDLFMAAGTPVTAPLPGRIHSFKNNAARLDYGPTVLLEHELPDTPRFYTLYGHLSEDSLAGLHEGMSVARGQRIGRIGAPPGNGGWPPHLHLQIVVDLLDARGDFPGVAPASRREVWLGLSPDPNLLLRFPPRLLDPSVKEPAGILDARRRRLGPSLSLSYRTPLQIVRGFGVHLYDQTGRAYLDVVNNVAHVGHGHPRVVAAAARQMAVLNTNTRYLHDRIVEYGERLTATLPEPLRVCFLVNSGSEANELALRLARAHTGGRDVVVVDGAYHGNTSALIDVSPYKFSGPGGAGAPPHVHVVPMPDDYRGLYRREDPRRGERFADHVRVAFDEVGRRGGKPAAFLCESLLSVGGQIVLPPGYLAAAYRHARAAGAVTIADEVQVGFGRVGSHFWGFETQGVVPDIVTLGKPIGNGHPLGAVVTTAEIAASFANGMEYFNTFGGNPVSCAVGLAVLDVIRDEGLQSRALRVGAHFKSGLERLMDRHAVVGDVRGLGLFLGIELVLDRVTRRPAGREARYLVERMKERGVLLSTDGPSGNVVKTKPPLVFSEADADRVVADLDAILAEDFLRVD